MDEFLESYVDLLYRRSNLGLVPEQRGLYTKADYYKLLKPVVDLVSKDDSLSIEEARKILYEQSGINERIDRFINKREMAPGLVFSYGTKKYRETVIVGNRQEVTLDGDMIVPAVEEMTEDTIFDLASITKLFTSLSTLKLVSEGEINLNDEIVKYAPEFKNLGGVTIYDLLSFSVPIATDGRIEKATKETAEQVLFTTHVNTEDKNLKPYTDMGAMVLKYVIEHVSGTNFYQYVCDNILNKLNMTDTHVVVPKSKLYRVASTNLDVKFYKDGNVIKTKDAIKGTAYDAKARILGQPEGVLSGHAGLFSTNKDMSELAKGIIGGKIIDGKYVREMVKNRTGRAYIDEAGKQKYVQYLGYLCYTKNPVLSDSELYHAMSGRSLASAGWTGTQLTIDPLNELYFFLGSNRSHNRMTFIDGKWKNPDDPDNYLISEDGNGKKTILLPTGEVKVDATRFAWERDSEVVHPALRLAIQYKMLEDIYKQIRNENIKEDSNVKHIVS